MWIKTSECILVTGALLLLTACNTPSPAFRGIPPQTVTVGQSVFEVRQMDGQVELIRTNTEYAPTFASIIPRAAEAVKIATGCTPRPGSWTGEQTLMQVEVDCPDS